MQKLLVVLFLAVVLISCTNRDISEERQDSIEAAAAADSMLKEATEGDTTTEDKVAVDTSATDSL